MRALSTAFMALAIALTIAGGAGTVAAKDGIPHRQVADMLYELAYANRTVYTRDIVQRLANEEAVITASEHFRDEKGLPLPAQMFRFAAEELETNDFWLALRSLTPINFGNGPITPVEEQGLEYVRDNPTEPFYAEEDLAGRRNIVAIYADVASVEACVSCHNAHPESPRQDFEIGDVMGGVVIRLFVEE